MMSIDIELIGYAAGLLTTVAFAPQVVRTWQLGGHELSWSMLALFTSGVTLWLVYGVARESAPLMFANGLTLLQVLLMAGIKMRSSRRGVKPEGHGPSHGL
jgi:MtN3 and saliva related transmembrane protein